MSLISLAGYKTLSDKKLLEAFNEALVAADANFVYTLDQVASPVPSLIGVPEDYVLTVNQSNALEYKDVSSVIDLQTAFNSYLSKTAKIGLTSNLEFSLAKASFPFAEFSITGRNPANTGPVNNYVTVSQTSNSGQLDEDHSVGLFTVTANSAKLTSTLGYVELNKLQVGNYKFPNAAGTAGQVLTLGASNTLEFVTLNSDLVDAGDKYTLSKDSPLFFEGKSNYNPNITFKDSNSGLGVFDDSNSSELFFKLDSSKLLSLKKPTVSQNNPADPYIKLEGPTVLPDFASKTSGNSYPGSIWYDQNTKSLVLVSDAGSTFIQGQATAASVNTVEAKTFTMNPNASFALGSGSVAAPSLSVGDVGVTGADKNFTLVFDGSAKVKITQTSIEAAQASNGAAKVLLDSAIGINNPANPPYTFAGATQLGLFRSGVNAVGVAVQGTCVSEFTSNGLDLKSKKIFNIGTPTAPSDVTTKSYVDDKLPSGSVAGAVPIYSVAGQKYVQSEIRYASGVLDVGGASTGVVRLKNTSGGTTSLRTASGVQNLTFTLPSSNLNNGLLSVNAQGNMYWESRNTVIDGLLKTDGSVPMTSGLNLKGAYTASNVMIGSDGTGLYASSGLNAKLGFASDGLRLAELDAVSETLKGKSDTLNAPVVRLNSSIQAYSASADSGLPTYAFAGSATTGVGQLAADTVSLFAAGDTKLSVSSEGVTVHGSSIKNLANPVAAQDAATKAYVDNAVVAPVELSFRVTSLPSGWSPGNALTLSIADKALVYVNTYAYIDFLPNPFPENVVVPENFETSVKCQCYVENFRLIKVPKNGIRQAARLNGSALILNYNVAVNDIITVQLG
jgi:hypothetical protein